MAGLASFALADRPYKRKMSRLIQVPLQGQGYVQQTSGCFRHILQGDILTFPHSVCNIPFQQIQTHIITQAHYYNLLCHDFKLCHRKGNLLNAEAVYICKGVLTP